MRIDNTIGILLKFISMKNLLFIISILIFLTSCEEKYIYLYPSFKENTSVTLNSTGAFSEGGLISASEIKSAIDDLDLEESGAIDAVSVEGLWLIVEKLSNNTAQTVNLNLDIENGAGGESKILDDFVLNISNERDTVNLPNELKEDGISEIKKQLSSIILDDDANDIQFNLTGTAESIESVVNIKVEIYVKGSVVFKQTIDSF